MSDDEGFLGVLREWHREGVTWDDDDGHEGDPTALADVDRVMRRLGHRPSNPDSTPYDDLPDDVAMYELDGRHDSPGWSGHHSS